MSDKIKYSVGLACFRKTRGLPTQLLLVRKRVTYYYSYFVLGKYTIQQINSDHIIKIFSNMTMEEKIDILSLNFTQMWYRLWPNRHRMPSEVFRNAKQKFETNFLFDGGIKLRKLINKSSNAELLWEMPKGRKLSRNEAEINAALREFTEETGIKPDQIRIWPNIIRAQSYTSESINYVSKFFLATCRGEINPTIRFDRQTQIDELSDVRWCTSAEIAVLNPQLCKFARPLFNYVKVM